MTAEDRSVQGSTRDRLLAAGLRLFAERGYRSTTVGDIEQAAGLQPRRGALYKHFASKQALLEAAARRHVDAVAVAGRRVVDAPADDVGQEARLLGQWLLGELDAEHDLVRVLEQDGDRLPTLRDAARVGISDHGYRAVAALLGRWLGDRAADVDLDAVAVVLLGPLINHRRSGWTFGAAPLGLDDRRVVEAWADVCELFVRSHGEGPPVGG